MTFFRVFVVLSSAMIAVAACAPSSPGAAPSPVGGSTTQRGSSEPSRTLVAITRVEPASLASQPLGAAGLGLPFTMSLFNASLAIADDGLTLRPYLAEALPQLNTETWRVFPDGRMETTYRLKRDLAWHDGTAMSADDFAFAWRVYTTPGVGQAGLPPWSLIEAVTAPDPRSLLIQWKRPYPKAGALKLSIDRQDDLPPLPRHILQQAFAQDDADAFASHAHWTREYVGLGPYRLERWEAGAFLEAAAFDGFILGRAQIDRLKIIFIPDPNTVVANLLSGEAQIALDDSIRFQQGVVLKRAWAPTNTGTVLSAPASWRFTHIQFRSELVTPRALLHLPVRKALAHAVDREALNDGLFDGEGVMAESMIQPDATTYAAVDRAIRKYPFDLRRSEQLMGDVGFSKGADGFQSSPTEGRFAAEMKVLASAHNQSEMSIMGSVWRQAGFDFREAVLPAVAQNLEDRAVFPSVFTSAANLLGEPALAILTTEAIPRPETRWVGNNRGGWSHPDYDRLLESFNSTLDRTERDRLVVRMAALFTEELPMLSLYFNLQTIPFVSALQGPRLHKPPDNLTTWNVHEWRLLDR